MAGFLSGFISGWQDKDWFLHWAAVADSILHSEYRSNKSKFGHNYCAVRNLYVQSSFFFNSFSSGFNFYNVGSDITIIILISFQSPWACARFLRHRRILLISIMRWKLHSTRGCWTLLASCRPPLVLWWRGWAKMSKDRLPKPTLRTCRPSLSSKLSSRLPREWPPYVVSLSNVKKCIANLL